VATSRRSCRIVASARSTSGAGAAPAVALATAAVDPSVLTLAECWRTTTRLPMKKSPRAAAVSTRGRLMVNFQRFRLICEQKKFALKVKRSNRLIYVLARLYSRLHREQISERRDVTRGLNKLTVKAGSKNSYDNLMLHTVVIDCNHQLNSSLWWTKHLEAVRQPCCDRCWERTRNTF